MTLPEPATVPVLGFPAPSVALVALILSIACFTFIMWKRVEALRKCAPDPRFSNVSERLKMMLLYGFGQLRQPRYLGAGILHILLFAGFMILSIRSLTLIGRGFSAEFHLPLFTGSVAYVYDVIKDYTVLVVLGVCLIAMVRRAVWKPSRYAHPGMSGHEGEAFIILGLVSALMITDMLYDGSAFVTENPAEPWYCFPASALASSFMKSLSYESLSKLHVSSYWAHIVCFFGLLNYLPISKHFHVITAIPNVYFANLNHGTIKPVKYGTKDWMDLDQCGVNDLTGFTWKHVLDFYSCADCGRCTDNCPANIVGRSLSPKMISIKARDYAYEKYPILGAPKSQGEKKLVGDIITEDEIWACTTCGACEQECPIFIEYIDKIVDMRRYLLEQGAIPQSLQKPLQQIKKKGNAYGAVKGKRAAWSKDVDGTTVKELKKGDTAEYLFFVDSCGSFDPRIQEISKSFSRILGRAGCDFGILGQDENDSGNEVRRIGEEGLFEQVSEKNIEAFESRTFRKIVAFDPHAYNVIKNDYPKKFPVMHSSQLLSELIRSNRLNFTEDYVQGRLVTYHDPCYLGRHNNIYEDPRQVLNSIPRLRFRDMERCRSRSFCCSGGGIMLWYENEQETQRMGEKRVRMAQEIGAQLIITACPFCLINIEDAIKTTGNEGKMEVIDLVELVDRSIS